MRGPDSIDARYSGLVGKRVVVTGGASGIGLCLVNAFAAQGASVVAIDVDAAAIAEARAVLPSVQFIEADLSIAEMTLSVMAEIARDGPIDVLIPNAADDSRHAWHEVTPQVWHMAFAVNLNHQFFCAQAAAQGMAARKQGVIIFVGSVAALRGKPAMIGYLAAKAAVEGLMRGLARELGPEGVRVTAIIPGAIDTPRQRRLWRTPEVEARLLADQALPVLLDGWDVAALAVFLASDGGRGAAGQAFVLDAGLS
jgi:D-xylose 1-dehydrogenase